MWWTGWWVGSLSFLNFVGVVFLISNSIFPETISWRQMSKQALHLSSMIGQIQLLYENIQLDWSTLETWRWSPNPSMHSTMLWLKVKMTSLSLILKLVKLQLTSTLTWKSTKHLQALFATREKLAKNYLIWRKLQISSIKTRVSFIIIL